MRNYLKDFFKEFDYDVETAAFFLAEYDKITKNEEAFKLFDGILSAYENGTLCDYEENLIAASRKAGDISGVHPYTAGFLVYACMSRHLAKLYKDCGIDYSIYKNSVLDLKWKLYECKAVKGVTGISAIRWIGGFFRLELFALGRLQYEILKAKYDYSKNGILLIKGVTPVINVHIPRTGEPLDKASCDASYDMAREFFKKRTGEDNLHFVCHSWLLFPLNKEILPKGSNTYRFMSEYDIITCEYNLGEDLWRLFDTDEKNPDKLPCDTSFRRCYVEHLKRGGRVGEGYGIKP